MRPRLGVQASDASASNPSASQCYRAVVRTTLTLDDDLAAEVRRRAAATGRPFRQVLNEALRAGLHPQGRPRPAVEVTTVHLGLRPGVDLTRARRLASDLEDDEVVREMQLRK